MQILIFIVFDVPGVQPLTMSTPMYGSGSHMTQTEASMGGTSVPEIAFSGKHSGICIYFSRIIG